MANGDITKKVSNDKIEVVGGWNILTRKATIILEEQSDGSITELSRSFNRSSMMPFHSVYTAAVEEVKDSDGNVTTASADASWTHNATDISGLDADVQAIATPAWTDAVKNSFKAMREAEETL